MVSEKIKKDMKRGCVIKAHKEAIERKSRITLPDFSLAK
jgi:hypothetical protein